MRIVFSLLFSLCFLWATPASIDEVYHSKFVPIDNGVKFELQIAPKVHIYKSSIKVKVNNKPISIKLPPAKKDAFGEEIYQNRLELFIPVKSGKVEVTYQGCSDEMVCYAPKKDSYTLSSSQNSNKVEEVKKSNSEEEKIVSLFKGSLLTILGTFFLFGVLLSLTPCVFPMIPILSGLIIRSSKHSFIVSLIYVLSMSVAYTIAGVLAGLFGANLQILFQNQYVIVLFSLIFISLALSMFGFYEIGLPSSIQTKLSKKSDEAGRSGGVLGIAIMGFLSALIVGPCVAPPLAGALLYIGQSGDAFLGGMALFVMSIGMGLPLLIIGFGANKIVPRAGGWMIGVNRVFGVIMLGVAIYMLSRVVPQYVTTILWGVLAIGSGLYLNPFSKMDNYKEVLFKTFGFLLVVVGTAFIFKVVFYNGENNFQRVSSELKWNSIQNVSELKRVIDSGDNVLIDFTAKWCVACKEYEEITFQDSAVKRELKKFKLYKVDVTENSKEDIEMMRLFKIVGPPAILVVKNGKVEKIVGYKEPAEFLKSINKE